MLQWIRMAWKTVSTPSEPLSLRDLADAWNESTDERWSLLASDGTRRWSQTRGPIGALFLTLDRLGWSSDDGLSFTDDTGIRRTITDFTPAQWKIFLKQAVQAGHEAELGLNTGCPELRGVRVCVDFVQRSIRSCRTSSDGARLLLANACNAVWTRTRASLAGYVVPSTLCELCG